jgi:hypothetical protein
MTGVIRIASATAGFILAFEVTCIGWSAIDIFVLHNIDPKWGDALGNFQVAIQVVQYFAVGSGLTFLACVAVLLRIWLRARLMTVAVMGVIAGIGGCILVQCHFGFWLTSMFALGSFAAVLAEVGAAGLVTGLLGSVAISHLGQTARIGGAVA